MKSGDGFDPRHVVWVLGRGDVAALIDAMRAAPAIVYDVETTGVDEHAVTGGSGNGGVAARVVLASITTPPTQDEDEPTTWVIPLSHPNSPWMGQWRRLWTLLASRMADTAIERAVSLVGHNVKFDHRYTFAVTGVDMTSAPLWDTMVAVRLIDESAPIKLKEIVPMRFGVPRWDDHDLSAPGAAERVPLMELGLYAARDTYWTWRLFEDQRAALHTDDSEFDPITPDELVDARVGQLAEVVSMPCVATLTSMEQRGVCLDQRWTSEALAGHREAARDARAALIERYAGSLDETDRVPSFAPTSLYFRDWTAEGVRRGELHVAALTPRGVPQWSALVLNRQAMDGSEVAAALLDLRSHEKKAEFLSSWLDKVSPAGRIHASYHVGWAVSGRLSSSHPNMQQVTGELKPAFVPSPGYVMAEIDYSQIELRVAAYISGCEAMREAFNAGDDLHRLFAARLNNKPVQEVTKEERRSAKAGNFGLLFGMSPKGFVDYAEAAYGVVLTLEEAHAMHSTFFDMWSGLREWHVRAEAELMRTGQVVSPLGRVRRPDLGYDDRSRGDAVRQAINSPVQGTASDLMQLAASSIEGNLPGVAPVPGVRLVGTVHDSIMVELPQDDWERAARDCQERMATITDYVRSAFGVHIDVPLASEAKIGTRWGLDDVATLE